MALEIRVLQAHEAGVLQQVAPGVFDHAVIPALAQQFCADPRHHLVVALDGDRVVGMVSAVHYLHPDKPPQLWINEVGVAPAYRQHGCATTMLTTMLRHGATLGCNLAWVLTDEGNPVAQRLYVRAGGQRTAPAPVLYAFRIAASPPQDDGHGAPRTDDR